MLFTGSYFSREPYYEKESIHIRVGFAGASLRFSGTTGTGAGAAENLPASVTD